MKKKIYNAMAALALLFMPLAMFAQSPPNLGAAGDFVLYTNNGPVTLTSPTRYTSHITGNVGYNNGGNGAASNFGNIDGLLVIASGTQAAAQTDLNNAYSVVASQGPAAAHAVLFGAETLNPGIYSTPVGVPASLNGILTLDGGGSQNAYFLFKIGFDFSAAALAEVKLINGAQACNVFWVVEGPIALATGTIMKGTMIANNAAISMGTNVNLEGRALSTTGAISVNDGLTATIPLGCGRINPVGPVAPNLGAAECYALMTASGAMTEAGTSEIIGDVGSKGGGLITGYTAAMVTGNLFTTAGSGTTPQAGTDVVATANYLNTLPVDIELLVPSELGHSLVLTPHVYFMSAGNPPPPNLTDTIFFNAMGNPDAVFVIKMDAALTTAVNAKVALLNGAQSKNIFWLVNGSVNIAGNSTFRGTVVAFPGAIGIAQGDTIDGRLLSTTGAITTASIYVAANGGSPTITPGSATTFCQGDSVILTSSTASSYTWSTGAQTQSIKVFTSGNYSVSTPNACTGVSQNSLITTVKVNPTYSKNQSASICPGDSLFIGGAYRKLQGSYRDTLSTILGCDSIIVTALSINPTYRDSLTASICQGDSLLLGGTYRKIQGSYSDTLATVLGCDSIIVTTLSMKPMPAAGFMYNLTGETKYSFINYSVNSTTYRWDFGDNQISLDSAPTHTYAFAGTYTVKLTATNSCGSDSSIKILNVLDLEFFNGFSPNGDDHNDDWQIPVLSYNADNSVLIINRWGDEVWKGINYDNHANVWTGKNMNGNDLPDGNYYYIIKYGNVEKRGWVIVKR
jgi:gliding motility-associated-like protein